MESDRGETGAVGACALRLVPLVAILSVFGGCLADGPGGGPLGVNFAADSAQQRSGGTEVAAADETAGEETDGRSGRVIKASASDRRIAEREAAAESGTISGSAAIDRLIEKHAKENDIPPALAYAVVRVESRYNPRAHGVGVYGLSQIKPATARSLGFSGPASALYDPDVNLTYGMRYLKGAWEQGGHDVCRAAMKYKGGHRTTHMSRAAARYCSAVKAHMAAIAQRRQKGDDGESKGLLDTLVAAVAPAEEPAETASETPHAPARTKAAAAAKVPAPRGRDANDRKDSLVSAAAFAPADARAIPVPGEQSRRAEPAKAPERKKQAVAATEPDKGARPAEPKVKVAEDSLAARMAGFGE
ncbi:lytic transglycosylase domain-containing protein [Aurantimonas sp. VKM B-3413]|uniref:lytic transglycosylase domain-containing protein n=1 Tax=Aurantimonas sp. VKM B-3413 TaxID=2779401 RepID=UPI001E52D75E|nr:transglycosylase SLT domain-containing protein [Aurantimonas sp. VKM B-3413]MCB8840122.1 transglycosylase SLT domain-containing protein [Aurantimonas sp. VKM B-3413]